MVENTGKDHKEEKYQLLLSLYDAMAMKYNMTIEEFNNFSNVAYEALSEPKPEWTFFEALEFVFHCLFTIGKVKYDIVIASIWVDLKVAGDARHLIEND